MEWRNKNTASCILTIARFHMTDKNVIILLLTDNLCVKELSHFIEEWDKPSQAI